jgi:hypothetical protein
MHRGLLQSDPTTLDDRLCESGEVRRIKTAEDGIERKSTFPEQVHDVQEPFARTRLSAVRRADEELRRDDPLLWWLVTVLARVLHPWIAVRLLWLDVVDWWERSEGRLLSCSSRDLI